MPFLKDKCKLQSRSQKLNNLTKKNGLRRSIFNVAGAKYIGEWKNNTKDGKGSLLTETCRLYEGDWETNFRHRFGVLAFRQENKVFILQYRGDWKKGKESGFGARHYPDGSYYLGNWKNGKRHGYGQMWYADGAFYDGDWVRDLRHGLGMLVRADGNRYEGSWEFDLKHGKGRFFHLDSGQMQEGVWREDFCTYSFIVDIPFRQTTLLPTAYPIQTIEVISLQEVCDEQELKALAGKLKSCLNLSKSSLVSAKGSNIHSDTIQV